MADAVIAGSVSQIVAARKAAIVEVEVAEEVTADGDTIEVVEEVVEVVETVEPVVDDTVDDQDKQ